MDKPEFVYTTFINTTPGQLWRGLTEPVFTRRYWELSLVSDWQVGSTVIMEMEKGGVTIADPAQVVLESDRYRRLSYTWHTFTPEWAEAYNIDDEYLARVSAERRSKVTFDIEPIGSMVKLTLVHDDFEPGSAVLEAVTQGWPLLLSSLKTLLETGDALPQASG